LAYLEFRYAAPARASRIRTPRLDRGTAFPAAANGRSAALAVALAEQLTLLTADARLLALDKLGLIKAV
jgi:hypothetical protein